LGCAYRIPLLRFGSEAMMARRRLGGFALAVALGLIAVARAAPAQDRWETYTKPRFGTIADYPVGADIYYERCNFPPHITHRAQEKAVWDPIMTASPSPCGPVQR
jgi:hypothetical protein